MMIMIMNTVTILSTLSPHVLPPKILSTLSALTARPNSIVGRTFLMTKIGFKVCPLKALPPISLCLSWLHLVWYFVNAGDLFINDDASSQSSFSSCNYSNINYFSGNEDDHHDLISCFGKSHKSRFCPSESRAANSYKHCNSQLHHQRPYELNHPHCRHQHHQQKLPRIQSLMDVRSQLLHRSLVEEINKRRLFKTVGAVEDIGFQTPGS